MVAHAPEARRHKRFTALSESRCGSGRRMSNMERLLFVLPDKLGDEARNALRDGELCITGLSGVSGARPEM
jgi:hypothetical protein